MEIIIATHNDHKAKEIIDIFNGYDLSFLTLKDLNDFEEIEETGNTFSENAVLKAKTIAEKYGRVTLSDDSGLSVSSLNGEPGIYSARYSGLGDKGNNELLLRKLKNNTDRSAYFTSVLAVVMPNGKTLTFEGIWQGHIAHKLEGEHGFGYDPLFIPNGYDSSVATLDPKIKNQISHRARALEKLKEHIHEIIDYR